SRSGLMSNDGSMSRPRGLLPKLSAAGILLRFAAIDRSYWFDELATVDGIDAPRWQAVLRFTAGDIQPPLYNSMAFAWTRAFGFTEFAVRSLSLIIGLAA